MPVPSLKTPPPRIRIENPWPMIDCGRWPAKRVISDTVEVSADVWRDGHDLLRADVRYKAPGDRQWQRAPMHRVDAHEDGDRWAAVLTETTR